MIRKLIYCVAIILMSAGYAWADTMSTQPTFLISSLGQAPNTNASAYGTAQSSIVLGGGTTTITNSPASYSYSDANTSINSFADPGNFIVNTNISSSNVNSPSSVSSVDAVGQWFILNGELRDFRSALPQIYISKAIYLLRHFRIIPLPHLLII